MEGTGSGCPDLLDVSQCVELLSVTQLEEDDSDDCAARYSPMETLSPTACSTHKEFRCSSPTGSRSKELYSSSENLSPASCSPKQFHSSMGCVPPQRIILNKSPKHRFWRPSERHLSSDSSSVFSPSDLDSPDSAFRTTPKQSKLGFFLFLANKERRCSAPVSTAPLQHGPHFKSDMHAIAEGRMGGDKGSRETSPICASPIRIIVSSSGEERGSRLQRSRVFGSTGDLLNCKTEESKPRPLEKKCLGGSLEQVSQETIIPMGECNY